MRWCITWLCLRLCNIAAGTKSICGVRKMAVPSTRWGGCANKFLMNISSGIDSLMSLLRSSWRPRYHVMMQVKSKKAKAMGYQPPALILINVAVQKAKSITKNKMIITKIMIGLICHSRRMTMLNKMVVISMVELTEMPYAAARLTDSPNSTVVTMTMINKAQFTAGI